MSYGFTLNFLHCRNAGAAFEKAHTASELCYDSIRDLLEMEDVWIPSIRYCQAAESNTLADELWLTKLLQMDFIWWPEHKLLALSGGCWPENVLQLFKCRVYFQNSCDQDYDFKEWKGLRSPFRRIVDTCRNGDLKEVEKILQMGRSCPEDYIFEEMESSREQYYRRWAAYNGIYETLHLDNWLYGNDDKSFVRFTMTPLNSSERSMEAKRLMRALVNTLRRKP